MNYKRPLTEEEKKDSSLLCDCPYCECSARPVYYLVWEKYYVCSKCRFVWNGVCGQQRLGEICHLCGDKIKWRGKKGSCRCGEVWRRWLRQKARRCYLPVTYANLLEVPQVLEKERYFCECRHEKCDCNQIDPLSAETLDDHGRWVCDGCGVINGLDRCPSAPLSVKRMCNCVHCRCDAPAMKGLEVCKECNRQSRNPFGNLICSRKQQLWNRWKIQNLEKWVRWCREGMANEELRRELSNISQDINAEAHGRVQK